MLCRLAPSVPQPAVELIEPRRGGLLGGLLVQRLGRVEGHLAVGDEAQRLLLPPCRVEPRAQRAAARGERVAPRAAVRVPLLDLRVAGLWSRRWQCGA